MSGTSADGVDIAIVAIDGRGYEMSAQLIAAHHRPYNEQLRRQIFAFRSNRGGSVSQSTLRELAEMGREISLTYAAAVNEALVAAHLEAKNLAAVAAHGQTLFHDPPNTIQWLDPSLVAAEVGCAVVSDFRRADLAAGGQGAPLVPFADFILFRHPKKNRVLLNIGGIANITWLPANASVDQVIAFDTGPGNCVSDYLCRREFPDGPGYDDNGNIARRGNPSRDALQYLITTDYFRRKPPKSTDGPAMIALFESAKEARNLPFVDRVATALLFCISSIQQQMKMHLPGEADELIVSGGGTRNFVMMHHLRAGFSGEVKTTDDLGMKSEAKEAIAFALLGAATLDGVPSNVPSVTGANRPVILGSITPRP